MLKDSRLLISLQLLLMWCLYICLPVTSKIDGVYLIPVAMLILNLPFFILKVGGHRSAQRSISFGKYHQGLLTISCIIGLACSIYDKVVIQGIDYSLGVSAARYALQDAGSSRIGASSVFSVLGYFFSSAGFLLTPYVHVFGVRKHSMILHVLSFITVLVISILTGGRTSILIYLIFTFGSFYYTNNILQTNRLFPFSLRVTGIIFFTVSALFLYVFYERAASSSIDAGTYASNMIEHMKGTLTNQPSDILSMTIVLLVYFYHSLWINAGILFSATYEGYATFNMWRNNLSKFHLSEGATDWDYSGYFCSLDFSVYYDYGIIGVLILQIVLIWSIIKVNLWSSRHITPYRFYSFLIVFYLLITKNFIVGTDLMMFPPLVIYMIIIKSLSLFYGNRNI